ncbi:MAG: serine hydrolase [Phaeodactylibacter sp.]|nr:serine hydrolase [Phaeodactylibacter sp.]
MKISPVSILLLVALACLPLPSKTYPIDGYDFSGIRRLVRLQLILEGEIKDTQPIPGAQKSINDIQLNLLGSRGDGLDSLPQTDPGLQRALNGLFPSLHESYSVTLLDITEGKPVRYAQRQPNRGFQPGSVGKLAVVAGLFCELENLYPDSFELRQELLKTRTVRAGPWAIYDEHTVPFFDPETKKFSKRQVQEKDIFSLFEWADHMLSVSNNGAAAVVWREVILMRVFGEAYPGLTEEQAEEYFRTTPKGELSELAISVVNDPLRDLGISEDEWRLGKMFTRGASNIIPPKGGSTGSPAGLMKFMIAMERGQLIDPHSSLEIKRLMYMTDRRIRYAASPALTDAAVYFKSGSLYKCKPEEGYQCGKYKGNVDNFMNSVAIIEHPDSTTYLVALMSNVLKKNSNIDHNALASRIDKIVRN